MTAFILIKNYIIWHYTQAVADLWHLAGNFIWFLYHFFSMRLLTRTLFSKWRRLGESSPQQGFHPGKWLGALFVNFIMRIVGFGARFSLLLMGTLAIVTAIAGAALAFVVWFFIPVILIGIFILGSELIFSL